MSCLETLGISGIRSYSPANLQVINFQKPVTQILGENGAGKTSILEALKMAQTGTQPSSSTNGKSFIYDPHLIEDTVVNAVIKLKFKAINSKSLLCVRGFQLKYKYPSTNQNRDLSPDNISEFKRVEQFLRLKDDNNQEETLNFNSYDLDRQVCELMGVNKLIIENVILTHQEDFLWPFYDQATLSKIFDDLFNTTRLTRIKDHIQKVLNDYQTRLKYSKGRSEQHSKNLDEYSKNLQEVKMYVENMHEAQQFCGKKQEILQKLTENSKTIQENDNSDPTKIFDKIDNLLESENREYYKLKLEYDNIKSEIKKILEETEEVYEQNTIDEIIVKKDQQIQEFAKIEEYVEQSKKELDEICSQKIGPNLQNFKLGKNTPNIDIFNEFYINELRNDLESWKNIISKINKNDDTQKIDVDTVLPKNAKLFDIEIICNDLISQINLYSEKLDNQIEGQKQLLYDQKANFNQYLYDKNIELVQIDDKNCSKDNCNSKDFEDLTKNLTELTSDLQFYRLYKLSLKYFKKVNIQAEAEKQLTTAKDKYNFDLKDYNQIWVEFYNKKEEFKMTDLQSSKFSQEVSNLTAINKVKKEELDKLEQEKKKLLLFFDISKFNKKPLREYPSYQRELKEQRDKLLEEKSKNSENDEMFSKDTELAQTLDEINTIKKDKFFIKECCTIDKNIEKLNEYIDKIEIDINKAIEQIKFQENKVEVCRKELCLQREKKLQGTNYNGLIEKIRLLNDKITIELNKLSYYGVIQGINVKEKNHYKLFKEVHSKADNIDKLEKDIFMKTKIVKNKKDTMGLGEKVVGSENFYEDLELKRQNVSLDIEKKASCHESNQEQIDEKLENFEKSKKLQIEFGAKIKFTLKGLYYFDEKLKPISDDQTDTSCDKAMDLEDQPNTADKINFLNSEILQSQQTLMLKDKTQKKYYDNIKLKELQTKREILKNEIDRYQTEMSNRKNELRSEFESSENIKVLKEEISKLKLSESSLKTSIIGLTKKLEEQSSSEQKYFEELSYHEFFRNACNDLLSCKATIERALLQFHSEKMSEINATIEEIWKQTYGYWDKDIKTIEIQSDITKDNLSEESKTKFNYRIVYKTINGKELDMKSRSSLGQKILASIVIRLALAEAFAANCKIIALDEPTTNLDNHNVERLANFLINLIEMKKQNPSFQMIIISHDQKFISLQNDYTDTYFKITKNMESSSIIEQRGIEDILT